MIKKYTILIGSAILALNMSLLSMPLFADVATSLAKNSKIKERSNTERNKNEITTRWVNFKNDDCSVIISYPYVGVLSVDAEVEFWAYRTLRTFRSGVKALAAGPSDFYSLHIDYDLMQSSKNVLSIVFKSKTDMGGAEPDSGIVTFNFDLIDGTKLNIDDILHKTEGLYPFLSGFAKDDLEAKLGKEAELGIIYSTLPTPMNFSLFALDANGLVLFFPQIRLGDNSLTDERVIVPLNALQKFSPNMELWNTGASFSRFSQGSISPHFSQGSTPSIISEDSVFP